VAFGSLCVARVTIFVGQSIVNKTLQVQSGLMGGTRSFRRRKG
jgi:hypothetical protein